LSVNHEVKKVLFIINRFSGGGFQPQVEGRIIEACESQDVECTIEFTQSRGHATELSRQAKEKGFGLVIAVGGDGTVNEVAQGLIHSAVPMGIIPKGSGNGLARHLGIPVSVNGALSSLFNSKPFAMDTFTVNGKLSLNVSGIGFDGHIANLFGTKVKRGLGGYVKLTMNEFFQFQEFPLSLKADGKQLDRKAFIVAIANSSQYGNNARIAPAASVCDGLLHISLLKKVPPYRLDFIYSFFTGNVHQSAYCEVIEATDLTITTTAPVAYHIDGEPSGFADTFAIKLQRGSLMMMAPIGKSNI
jgi:diacylglycerol kinase (ATP)